jgi:hypothetical protein
MGQNIKIFARKFLFGANLFGGNWFDMKAFKEMSLSREVKLSDTIQSLLLEATFKTDLHH